MSTIKRLLAFLVLDILNFCRKRDGFLQMAQEDITYHSQRNFNKEKLPSKTLSIYKDIFIYVFKAINNFCGILVFSFLSHVFREKREGLLFLRYRNIVSETEFEIKLSRSGSCII